jgi:hypothetical protein
MSALHLALVVGAVAVSVIAGALVEAAIGLDNVFVILVLIPIIVRVYLARRAALRLGFDGMTLDGRTTPWDQIGEVVVVGPVASDAIAVELRRRGGRGPVDRGELRRSRFDTGQLRGAFRAFAPATVQISGWGVDVEPPARPPRPDGAERSTATDTATAAIGTVTADDRALADAMLREDARRRLAAAATVVIVVAAVVAITRLWGDEPDTVAEDFVAVYPGGFFAPVDNTVNVPDNEGRLIGPRFDLEIDDVAVVGRLKSSSASPELPGSDSRPRHFRAAPDHELLLVNFGGTDIVALDDDGQPTFFADDPEADLTTTVVVADSAVRLEEPPEPHGYLVVSVPRDADALLEVSDHGRRHSISLRTGERRATTEGFYTEATQELEEGYAGDGQVLVTNGLVSRVDEATIELRLDRAERRPWLPGLGYARDGHAWLVVGPQPFDVLPTLRNTHPALRLDAAATFVLITTDGTETPALPTELTLLDTGAAVVFSVPETFRSGTIMIRPGAGSRWNLPGYAWEAAPPDDSVAIDLVEHSV